MDRPGARTGRVRLRERPLLLSNDAQLGGVPDSGAISSRITNSGRQATGTPLMRALGGMQVRSEAPAAASSKSGYGR